MNKMAKLLVPVALAFGVVPSASAHEPNGPVKLVNNGFCAGISWITLRPGETVTWEIAADYILYTVKSANGEGWTVYAGNKAATHGTETELVAKGGVAVRAAVKDGQFNGYLAQTSAGWQNHFVGGVFLNDHRDKAFFERVDFGPAGAALCKDYWKH